MHSLEETEQDKIDELMVRHGFTDPPLRDENKDKAVQDIIFREVIVTRTTAINAIFMVEMFSVWEILITAELTTYPWVYTTHKGMEVITAELSTHPWVYPIRKGMEMITAELTTPLGLHYP